MKLCATNGATLDIFDMVAGKLAMEMVLTGADTAPPTPKANATVKISLFEHLPPPSSPPSLATQEGGKESSGKINDKVDGDRGAGGSPGTPVRRWCCWFEVSTGS